MEKALDRQVKNDSLFIANNTKSICILQHKVLLKGVPLSLTCYALRVKLLVH